MKTYHRIIGELFSKVANISLEEAEKLIEFPPQEDQGDRGIPCFRFSKTEKKSPPELAKAWAEKIASQKLPMEISRVEAVGGYVNFHFNMELFSKEIIGHIFNHGDTYGKGTLEHPETVIVEYSSPNIAKPLSIGHLRSTNLGASIARIFAYRGYKVVRINHLGDWGTQFGKLTVAYRRWGKDFPLDENPMEKLFTLYVKFHEDEPNDPSLTTDAREAFAKLERGDAETQKLWEKFREVTFKELERLYSKLGVSFDHYWGESFYVPYLSDLLDSLDKKKLSKESEGALIVDLNDHKLGVALLRKGDESSLYLMRDLAAAIYRQKHLQFSKMIYVVGAEQSYHFQQFFKVLELMGYTWVKDCEHVAFGSISFGDEKMSTRKGNIVFLSDVLDKAKEYALKIVNEKNTNMENKEEAAEKIALAAILFADISAKRIKNVKFSWEDVLSFEGETGPYLQYALVRTKSLVRKYGAEIRILQNFSIYKEKEEHSLIRALSQFPYALERAEREREPFALGQYLMNLTKTFNRFYNAHRVLDDDKNVTQARMLLVDSTAKVLTKGFEILGIPQLEKM